MNKFVIILSFVVMFVSIPTMAYAGNNHKTNNLKKLGAKIYVIGWKEAWYKGVYVNTIFPFCQATAKKMSQKNQNYLIKQCLMGIKTALKTSWLIDNRPN